MTAPPLRPHACKQPGTASFFRSGTNPSAPGGEALSLASVFVAVDGLRTNVESAGSGPPLLLLHGWGSSARTFAPVIPALSRSFTIYAPDFPGFGLSLAPSSVWGVDDYAAFVLHLLSRLRIERAHLVGHSHGGRVGIALAAGHPEVVNKLVLVNSAGIRPHRSLRLRTQGLIARSGRRILGHPRMGGLGQRSLAALYRRLGMTDYATAGPLRATFVKIVNEDLSARLPLISAPTLIVWGGRDAETPPWMGRQMATSIPGADLVILPRAGHYSFLDERKQFEERVLGFLGGATT